MCVVKFRNSKHYTYYYYTISFFSVIEKVLSFLIHIREQNNEIVKLLKKEITPTTLTQFRLEDLPVNLPISTQTDLDILETFLKDKKNFSTMVNIYY